MRNSPNIYQLPSNLPIPADDGACAHLVGIRIPSMLLPATSGDAVNLAALSGRIIVYCYPRTGLPDRASPQGWDEIPGARGCTPQSCAFRDHHQELQTLGVRVFGLSTQTTDYQREAAERLHLPFPLLSDLNLAFTNALRLPTFEFEGTKLLKRVTLILRDGVIEYVFYPVFPPDRNAEEVVTWLASNPI